MVWVFSETKDGNFLSPYKQPVYLSQTSSHQPPPSTLESDTSFDIGNKISPSILLIIIILAVIFFISGLLHLLVRFLFRPTIRDPEDSDNVTALQGQLQQLFHLHDSGVDQSYIDTLPVFFYNAIMGLKKPLDCAVCLCEFEDDDKLRLLPKCSHAFHLECIDTWLLSHSTCPLCRGSLLPDFSPNNSCSPIVFVLESGSETSREMNLDRDSVITSFHGTNNTHLGINGEDELGSSCTNVNEKVCEIPIKEDVGPVVGSAGCEEKVVTVKLGKFRNLDVVNGGEGSTSTGTSVNGGNSNLDSRRCFSMGSFEYVMDESSSLQVSIRPTSTRKQPSKKKPLKSGHRSAMSECDGNSCREGFKGFEPLKTSGNEKIISESSVRRNKNESFSISKIWLRSKKDKQVSINEGSSRRAFSFRFPLNKLSNGSDDLKSKQNNTSNRTTSDIDTEKWDHCVSEIDYDEEVGSRNSLDSQASLPSFARKTLLWLVGRQSKVVHSSFSQNV